MRDQTTLKTVMLTLAAAGLSSCGGGDASSPPSSSIAPTPTPTPSPTPTPTPTPTTGATAANVRLADIQYASGATTTGSIPLLMDIYSPDEPCTSNRPTVLFVHGGGFISGNKFSGNAEYRAEQMNARGINFVSINYRLDPDNPLPSDEYVAIIDDIIADGFGDPNEPRLDAIAAAFEDTVSALNFLRDNEDAYCIDTNRLAYWGSSAGAYTVLQVAYGLDQFGIDRPEPLAVIDYWGGLFRPFDLEMGEAPFFVIHGTEDPTVDYQNAVSLTNRADTVLVDYALYTVIGAGHGGRATGIDTNFVDGRSLHDLTFDFVEAHLLDGTPVYRRVEITP